jgi:hypothetical protein
MTIKILALLYLLTHSLISSDSDRIELAFMYHLLHPNGRGRDVQCLLYGGNKAQCVEQMSSKNRRIFNRLEGLMDTLLIKIIIAGNGFSANDFSDFVDDKLEDLADEFREPDDIKTEEINAHTPVLIENWHPSAAENEIFSFAQRLISSFQQQDVDADSSSSSFDGSE